MLVVALAAALVLAAWLYALTDWPCPGLINK